MDSSAAATTAARRIMDPEMRRLMETHSGAQPLANMYTNRHLCLPGPLTATGHLPGFGTPRPNIMMSVQATRFGAIRAASAHSVLQARSAALLGIQEEPKAQHPQTTHPQQATSPEAYDSEDGGMVAPVAVASIPSSTDHQELRLQHLPSLPKQDPPQQLPDSPAHSTRSRKRRADSLKPAAASAVASVAKKPARLNKDPDEESTASNDDDSGTCCICMCVPETTDVATINGCEHQFCFECIETWSERENTCPLCKNRFSKIDRLHKTKRQKGNPKASKKVKNRDQRADLGSGNPIEGLLASVGAGTGGYHSQVARLLFAGVSNSAGAMDLATSRPRRNFMPIRTPRPVEDSFFESDNETETLPVDEEGFGNFRETLRSLPFGRFPVPQYASMPMAPPSLPVARSYARNGHMNEAGSTADTALEISDTDDEDDIEVLPVNSQRGRPPNRRRQV